jgi:SCY1-like protein 1
MSMFGNFGVNLGSVGNLFGASGPRLNYDLGDPYPRSVGGWTHYRGTAKEDGAPVSVFKFVCNDVHKERVRVEVARNGAKRLKTTRHPNILMLKDSLEVEEGDKLTIYVVTESVMPLEEHLKDLPTSTSQRDEYYALGIRQVATAVSFLANDCALVHGGVSMSTVVVTDRLDWKLGGLDLLSEHQAIGRGTHGPAPLVHAAFSIPDQYKPEEYRRGDWAGIPQGPPWAIDAWGLGCLIQEVYRGGSIGRTDQLRETDAIPQSLLKDYQRLLATAPERRYNPKKLVENSTLFSNKLVETITFLDNLTLKDSIEKESFFRHLPRVMESLAKTVVQRKILPQIGEALTFGSAPALAVSPMLHAAEGLSDDDFAAKVTPTIVKLFTKEANSPADKMVRIALLENISRFVRHVPDKLADETLFPAMSTSFNDEDPFLRELTLKAVLVLAPKLTQRTHGNLLKFLSKLQIDPEPPIRANTTILLGNIARYLAEATAKRVLLNAFTRALRDQFPPARKAGLMALCSTVDFYEPGEAATRVLPAAAPLTVDPEKEVRECAFRCLDMFTDLLKRFSVRVEEQGAEGATAAHKTDATKVATKTNQKGGSGGVGGALAWAVNAAAKRVGGGPPVDEDALQGRATRPEDEAAARGIDMSAKSFGSDAPPPRLYGESYTPTSTPSTTPQITPAKGGGYGGYGGGRSDSLMMPPSPPIAAAEADEDGDGWGDMDDDDLDADAEAEAERQARSRLSKLSTGGTTGRVASNGSLGGGASSDGWGDDDDDNALFSGVAAATNQMSNQSRPTRPTMATRTVGGHVALGGGTRGVPRGNKPAPMKLGAKKLNAKDIDLESMLN